MCESHIRHCRLVVRAICVVLLAIPAFAQGPPWSAEMGQSGLRRLYATGVDLGELLNRQVSYRAANRIGEARSEVKGFVYQWDSLVPVFDAGERPVLLRALARRAERFESGKVDASNSRFDFGAVYAPTRRSYIAAGLAYEHIDADLEFVNGTSTADGIGPRIDAGIVFGPHLAVGVRVEELHFDGDTRVVARTPAGPVPVDRDVEYRRRFLQAEFMSRYSRTQLSFLPPRTQLGWTGSAQYLETRYEPVIDSRGLPAVEPFGNAEHLGIIRGGAFFSATFGSRNSWTTNLELLFDHEFANDMNNPIDDRTTRYVRSGLGYVVLPGKRIQFEYQGFRSIDGLRSRNNFTLIGIIDF